MVYNARAPGEKIQVAREVVFKTAVVTEKTCRQNKLGAA